MCIRKTSLLLICMMLASCYAFSTRYRISPATGAVRAQDRDDVVEVVRRIAKEYRLPPTEGPEIWQRVHLEDNLSIIAAFGHMGSLGAGVHGRIVISVLTNEAGVYIYLTDLDQGHETAYLRQLREELERELDASFGYDRVSVIYRGKSGARFVAP